MEFASTFKKGCSVLGQPSIPVMKYLRHLTEKEEFGLTQGLKGFGPPTSGSIALGLVSTVKASEGEATYLTATKKQREERQGPNIPFKATYHTLSSFRLSPPPEVSTTSQ